MCVFFSFFVVVLVVLTVFFLHFSTQKKISSYLLITNIFIRSALLGMSYSAKLCISFCKIGHSCHWLSVKQRYTTRKKKLFFFQIHITENKQSNFNGICWVVVHFWINSGPKFPPQINKKKSTISFNRSTQRYPRKYCMCRNHKKSNDFQLYMNYSNPRSLTSSNFFIF